VRAWDFCAQGSLARNECAEISDFILKLSEMYFTKMHFLKIHFTEIHFINNPQKHACLIIRSDVS